MKSTIALHAAHRWDLVSRFSILVLVWVPASAALAQPESRAVQVAAVPEEFALPRTYSVAECAGEMGPPTLLTLHLHDVVPESVFAAITAQSGVRFSLNPQYGAGVSVDCDKQPFWEGLQTILNQSGYSFVGEHGNSTYWVQPASKPDRDPKLFSAPKVADGPFVVELHGCALTKTRQLPWDQPVVPGASPVRDVYADTPLRIEGRVLCDPKLHILSGSANIGTAIDDTGVSLMPGGYLTGPFNVEGLPQAEIAFALGKPADAAKSIKMLGGTAHVQVCAQFEKWEIHDPAHAGTLTRRFGPPEGQLIVTVRPATKALNLNDAAEVTITVDGDYDTNWVATQAISSSIRWSDADGKPVDSSGGISNDDGVDFTIHAGCRPHYVLDTVRQPVTLIITVPTDIRTVDIPFEFHDLPLP